MKRKYFYFLLLLLVPFFVNAKDLKDMNLKWTNDTESYYFDELYAHKLSDGFLLTYVDKIEKYSYEKGYISSYDLGESNIFVTYLWGENLVVGYTDNETSPKKFVLLDKDLKVLKKDYYDGEYYFSYSEDYDVFEIDGKLLFSDTYGNPYANFCIDEDFNIIPAGYEIDGSYINVVNNNIVTKYDKNNKEVASYTLDTTINSLYLYYANGTYLVSAYNGISPVGYLFDTNLKLIKKIDNFNYNVYVYNQVIYLEDYDYNLYNLDSNFNIKKVSNTDDFYLYLFGHDVLYDKYGDKLEDYIEEIDEDGNHLILAVLDNGSNYDDYDTELLFFDKNMKLIFEKKMENIDYSYYYWPCINVSNDYLAIAYLNNELGKVNIKFYDKKGNQLHTILVDDYGNTALPCIFNMTDYGINVALFPKQYSAVMKGKTDTVGELKILYYEMPYDIKVIESVGGSVLSSKTQAGSGEFVTFEVSAKAGYKLKEVFVTDTYGNTVVFTDYKFTMPSSDVTIEAIFVPENPETSTFIGFILLGISVIAVLYVVLLRKKMSWLVINNK